MRVDPTSRVTSGVAQILLKPEIKAMQYPYGEKDCSRQQESPHCMGKAGKDVRQPSTYAKQPKYLCHIAPLERNIIIHVIKPRRIRFGLVLGPLRPLVSALIGFAVAL